MSLTYQTKYNGLEIDWFAYCFPNRRSNKTLVEITLDFAPGEHPPYAQQATEIRDILISSGILTAEQAFPEQSLPHDNSDRFASLLAQTALLLQCKTGHRVSFFR